MLRFGSNTIDRLKIKEVKTQEIPIDSRNSQIMSDLLHEN